MIPGTNLENIKEWFVVFHHFNIANGQVTVFVNLVWIFKWSQNEYFVTAALPYYTKQYVKHMLNQH